VHAYEQDTEDEMVFLSADVELPPARGRLAFELREDGTFAESGLGAGDVPEEASGTWALDGDTLTLSEGATQGVPRTMRIATANPEKLVVDRHAAPGAPG
jgi:hypothetical protein